MYYVKNEEYYTMGLYNSICTIVRQIIYAYKMTKYIYQQAKLENSFK